MIHTLALVLLVGRVVKLHGYGSRYALSTVMLLVADRLDIAFSEIIPSVVFKSPVHA